MTDTNIGVYAVVESSEGFIMVERDDGSIGLCGGRKKQGENLMEAMVRELDEELGIDPISLRRTNIVQEFKSERWGEYEKVSSKVPKGFERHYFFWCCVEEKVKGNEEKPVKVDRAELVNSPFKLRSKVKEKILERHDKGWKNDETVFRS